MDDLSLLENQTYQTIRSTIINARGRAYTAVNFEMVVAYWEIGQAIVEAQQGKERAEYGAALLKYLAENLTKEFGKGYDERNLRNMRAFYNAFPIRNALRTELSWTHYRLLLKVENKDTRQFYLAECVKSNWSTRQLERQINSFFYERLLSSRDKDLVRGEIQTLEQGIQPQDVIRDPFVLEFLGMQHSSNLYEKDIEQGLINHMQKFLLELGRGFCFEARQKRITFDGRHFFIDLVFYNYLLKCFVLIDLKIGDLTHQDIGQMQMFVNYYTREMMNEGDNPPIGILLCSDKSEAVVKYTLSFVAHHNASAYINRG